MSTRGRKLIATNESSVVAKAYFDPIMVENGESNRCFPDPPGADESDGLEIFSEPDNLLDKPIATETVPRRWGRQFTKQSAMET